jgi:phenylacetate-CoA ligase
MLYEIVGTTLWNRAMPLVRYRAGDYIKLPHDLTPQQIEAICLGAVSFEGILGRKDDTWLLAPDGRRLTAIDHIPRDVEHVVRMQIIQERLDYIRILVLPAPGFSDIDKEQILRNAYQKLPKSMQITIEVVDELVRTAQMKTPFVIRRIG